MAILTPATGVLLEQTLDATYPHWHDGLSRAAYGRWFTAQLATPWGRRHLTRWALVDGEHLLAMAKLYDFNATLDGGAIRVTSIGAVFTLPAYRGRGVARELITCVVEKAAREGADLAMLFSEIDPGFYLRLGFDAVPLPELSLRVLEDERRGAPATMVRAGDDRDLPDIVAMDAARSRPFRFHLRRDRDLAHYAIAKKRLLAGLAPAGARELRWFIAEEGASAAAYVVISVKDGAWTIESCGDRDPSGARIGAILQGLVARDPAEARPDIRAWLPSTLRPPQLTVLSATAATDVMMIRALTEAVRLGPRLAPEDVMYWKADAV
jgi:GNAT superfamily N-acetyltransferase